MKNLVFVAFIAVLSIITVQNVQAQCTLPTGEYTWGMTDLADHIDHNFGNRSNISEIIIPHGTKIIIKTNDAWHLEKMGGLGDIIFKIEEGGELKMEKKELLKLSENSQLIIDGAFASN